MQTSDILTSTPAAAFLGNHGHRAVPANAEIPVKEVRAEIVRESGHFPNPTAEFEVAKIKEIITE